ncbi:MAG: sodium:solute symporter [Bacteroidetes bacterium]|nr:sodium:solute symporter [Bacteroidota bacterium]
MSSFLILLCVLGYFAILMAISWYTSKKADADSYFLGNKNSPWYIVAFGMLGDSLSGVTFISVPGAVGAAKFGYLQLVLGYFFGYIIISQLLLPLYYRLNLVSIYTYLEQRFGTKTQKTGAYFFLLSRILGAGARLFLAASVIQLFIFDALGIPFWATILIVILAILGYTTKGGIKTLVWTDSLQSLLLILGVVFSLVAICQSLHFSFGDMVQAIANDERSQIFFWDVKEKSFFFKQFIGGVFIAATMTGLDQNMMQKNLSCKNLGEAQKNITWFSVIMVITNVFFLSLGVLLWIYRDQLQIELPMNAIGKPDTDKLFPLLALNHLGLMAGIAFIVGLTAATFSSADSVLTTLTTSYYFDIANYDNDMSFTFAQKTKRRRIIHICFAILLFLTILVKKMLNSSAVIDTVMRIANYTYGPLLGLFAFGLFTKIRVRDHFTPIVCVIAPMICYYIDTHSVQLLNGYKFGNELILLNGTLTFIGLFLSKEKE